MCITCNNITCVLNKTMKTKIYVCYVTVLCFNKLLCCILNNTKVHYVVIYNTVLYCTVLYCNLLYSIVNIGVDRGGENNKLVVQQFWRRSTVQLVN